MHIHVDHIKQGDSESKNTLQLLNEIELRVLNYRNSLRRKKLQDEKRVNDLERERNIEYISMKQAGKLAAAVAMDEANRTKMNNRRMKKRIRIGK